MVWGGFFEAIGQPDFVGTNGKLAGYCGRGYYKDVKCQHLLKESDISYDLWRIHFCNAACIEDGPLFS